MFSTSFHEEEKIWSGIQRQIIFNPKVSIGDSLLWALNRNHNKIIQVIGFRKNLFFLSNRKFSIKIGFIFAIIKDKS